MPRLSGYGERRHAPIWDTLVHQLLPCDAWLLHHPSIPETTDLLPLLISPQELASGTGGEIIPAGDPRLILWRVVVHEYPTVRALEAKAAIDAYGWSTVIDDGWREMTGREI